MRAHPKRTIISVAGELDIDTCPHLAEAAHALIGAGHCLIVDLSGLTFIDPSGLNLLLALNHRARTAGQSLELAGVPAQAGHVLDLTRTRHLFTSGDGAS
ncbi:STAS domain-containing protein [Streptomyces racemochromogenes]|uniref:STAS domain-containing protein n=1 Tax=Streptomyces racemochromogenes TaxID=67353 RepID=A0ABW7PC63_9ACTN